MTEIYTDNEINTDLRQDLIASAAPRVHLPNNGFTLWGKESSIAITLAPYRINRWGPAYDQKTGETTDPYEHLTWVVGNDDTFVCFDHVAFGAEVAIHAVVNSESGCFIDTFAYSIVSSEEAFAEACGIVSLALDSLTEFDYPGEEGEDSSLDPRGWNYGGTRFIEDVGQCYGDQNKFGEEVSIPDHLKNA